MQKVKKNLFKSSLLKCLFFLITFTFLSQEKVFSACADYTITERFCACKWCDTYDGTCEYVGSSNGVCNYRGVPRSVPGTIHPNGRCKTQWWDWTPPCSAQEEPCTRTDCNDCTLPSCASVNSGNTNYTTTVTGDGVLCRGNSASCDKIDNCGDKCDTKAVSCYHVETNTTNPATPSWIKVNIDGVDYDLSYHPLHPALIKFPLTTNTKILASLVPQPTGSRYYGYRYYVNKADVYGDRLAVTSSNVDQVINEMPGLPNASILTQGSEGLVATNVYARNKCSEETTESEILRGFFRVNTLPTITSLMITGDGDEPRGCKPTDKYTGKEANNPLTITVKGSDANGSSHINGMFLWIVKDGYTIPPSYLNKSYIVWSGATQTDPNRIGLFFGVDRFNRWVSVYKSINAGGTLESWGRDAGSENRFKVRDSTGKTLIENIKVLSYGIDPTDGTYTFKIELTFPDNSPLQGKYNFYTSMTDKLSYYAGRTELHQLDTSHSKSWNFDFVNPIIENFTGNINNQRLATVNWASRDTESGIKDTVVNVYNTREGKRVIRKSPTPENMITLKATPNSSSIGLITPLISGWYYNSPINSTQIDINENDSGLLQFYVTVYDQACNYTTSNATTSPSFDLNRWIATRGGILFSMGRIRYVPKKIEGQEYNLGTELITTKTSLTHPATNLLDTIKNPTSVINVTDGNTLKPDRFDLLKLKLDRYKLGLKSITSLSQCGTKEVCILESPSSISIPPSTYSGKIIVVSEEDITVTPDIKAGNPTIDGLILFTGGNIVVNSESRTTGGTVQYDQIEAFMIAKGQIQLSAETNSPDKLQDGIRVYGSLISFASNKNNNLGILLQRDLGLLNVTNPVLIVNYHPKYARISELFFGKDNSAYKQEVGFKIW